MSKTKVNLAVIEETLLITLYAKASELQAAVRIIIDPICAGIVRAIDCNFDKLTTAKKSQI